MLVVRGVLKDYDWGVVDGLASWSGGSTGGPQAELWFGAHPSGPSLVLGHDGSPAGGSLAEVLTPERVPILVKLLAAARPLSVQLHPTAAVAQWMWQRQSDERRVLADGFEKTEMIVALGPFEAFVGWRDPAVAATILGALPGAAAAVAALAISDVRTAIRELLAVHPVVDAVAALRPAVAAAGLAGPELHAYATVAALYPEDAGALLTPLLGYQRLTEGEAVFVPAGVPHSYIHGTGLEVMTSSDNVLRLGLTSKQVFVDEALDSLDLLAKPVVLHTAVGDQVAPPGAPFRAAVHTGGGVDVESGRYRVVLLLDGMATVDAGERRIELMVGAAVILDADEPTAHVTVDGRAAVVTSP